MSSIIRFQIIEIIGILIYCAGLIFPNYFRFRASKLIKLQKTQSLNEYKQKNEDLPTNTNNLIPTINLEKIRMVLLYIFWVVSILVLLQNTGLFVIFPAVLFFNEISTEFNIVIQSIAFVFLCIGTTISYYAGKGLQKDFLFPDQPVRDDWSLCTNGIYRKIRHPFYSFMNIGAIAFPLLLTFLLLLILAPFIIYIQYKIATAEEHLMEIHFQNDFIGYKKTSRMFLFYIF